MTLFSLQLIKTLQKKREKHKNIQENNQESNKNQKQKLATFTFGGKESNHITKLFEHTNLRTTHRTNNSIQHRLKSKHPIHTMKASLKWCVLINMSDCKANYTGQTVRRFFQKV